MSSLCTTDISRDCLDQTSGRTSTAHEAAMTIRYTRQEQGRWCLRPGRNCGRRGGGGDWERFFAGMTWRSIASVPKTSCTFTRDSVLHSHSHTTPCIAICSCQAFEVIHRRVSTALQKDLPQPIKSAPRHSTVKTCTLPRADRPLVAPQRADLVSVLST